MTKPIVLDVGNCQPDHAAIVRMLAKNFDARVLQAHGLEDTLQLLLANDVALVLINRKLDQDYSDGTEILKVLKADEELARFPVMLITNYEEHQVAAVSMGAVPGFGKLSMNDATTQLRLAEVLAS